MQQKKRIHKKYWMKFLSFFLVIVMGIGYLPSTVDRDPIFGSQELIEAYADLLEVDTGGAVGSATVGSLILPSHFNGREDDFTSSSGMLLIDITGGSVIATANPNKKFSASSLAELETYWILLDQVDKELFQTIPEQSGNAVDADVLLGKIGSGGSANNEDVLSYYINSGSAAARSILINGITPNSDKFLELASAQVKGSMLSNKNLISSNGTYNSSQKFTAYDIYYFMYQLLKNSWFAANIGVRSLNVTGRRADGLLVEIPYQPYGMSGIKIPKGYEGLLRMVSGNQQLVLLRGSDSHLYLAVVLGTEKGTTQVMEKFLKVLDGEEYSEEPEVTPTPEPTPTEEEAEPSIFEEPTPTVDAQPTQKPKATPTIAPNSQKNEETKKPDTTSVILPTESNDARYQYIFGTNAQVYTIYSLPASFNTEAKARKQMTTIKVPVWKMTASGGRYASSMDLTINKKVAKNVQAIFDEIYQLDIKFPIKVLKGYGYRKVGGVGLSRSTLMSMHSFGVAIDINPGDYDNDYFLGAGNDLRDKSNPYCIPDEVIDIFEKYGWYWGGNFSICADTMHFQYPGLEFLTYQNNSPFRELTVASNYMKGADVLNLQKRLVKLGFSVQVDGIYGKSTANVIKKAQQKYGLPVTGIVDYKTWETIINLTHYMPYAF